MPPRQHHITCKSHEQQDETNRSTDVRPSMADGEGDEEELRAEDDVHHPYQAKGQDVLEGHIVPPHAEGEVDGARRQIPANAQQDEQEQGRPARLIEFG